MGAETFGRQMRELTSFQQPELERLWLDAFARGRRVLEIGDAATPPLTLLERRKGPLRVLLSPTNQYLPNYHCAAAHSCEELARALRRARAALGWDMVQLDLVPEGSATHGCLAELRESGWPIELRPWQVTPVTDLTVAAEKYRAGLPATLRKTFNHGANRLRRRGAFHFREVSGESDWERWLERALEVEVKGWKGVAGTAVLQIEPVHRYYRALFARLRERGQFALHLLMLGERIVAFATVLHLGAVSYQPKCSYDPEFADCSPGTLLQREIMDNLFADPLRLKFDLQYPAEGWKLRWSTGVERLLRVRIFADTAVGRAVYGARSVARNLRDCLHRARPSTAAGEAHAR